MKNQFKNKIIEISKRPGLLEFKIFFCIGFATRIALDSYRLVTKTSHYNYYLLGDIPAAKTFTRVVVNSASVGLICGFLAYFVFRNKKKNFYICSKCEKVYSLPTDICNVCGNNDIVLLKNFYNK